MRIRTIEDNFEYQAKAIMEEMKEDLIDMDEMNENDSLTDELLWKHKELLGEKFYYRVHEAIGFDSVGVVEVE